MVMMMTETSDTELERTVKVLWNLDGRGTRGPAPTLNRADIVEAAVAVADAGGFDALSMRSVAAHLGAGTMSLYRHVPGKAELIALMVDYVSAELVLPDPDKPWRTELDTLAREEWRLVHRHPWLATAPQNRTVPGPNSMRHYEAGLAVLLAAGLAPVESAHVMSALYTFVAGAAQVSLQEAVSVADSGMEIGQWYERQMAMLGEHFSAEKFPAITHVHIDDGAQLDTGSQQAFTDSFEYGLALLLDGVASRVADSGGPGSP